MHWFLPTGGDARDVLPGADDRTDARPTSPTSRRSPTACDRLGFDGMLTPCGTGCEDAWLATASLLPLTRRVKFLVAFRPALLSPTLAAQMASTYQRLSGGRLLVNIVTGAEPAELARFGVCDDKDTRYERTGEFVEVMRGAWSGEPFDFEGAHYTASSAPTTRVPPDPLPRIYFGGASDGGGADRGRATSTCTSRGASRPRWSPSASTRMRDARGASRAHARFGIRFHVIARPTADEAWAVADALLRGAWTPAAIAAAQADFATTQSVGQRADGRAARRRRRATSSCTPTCGPASGSCAAASAPRSSAPTTRSPIASREYHGLGFDEFILSGLPAPRGGVLVRRGRDAGAARRRGLLPPLDGPAAPVFSLPVSGRDGDHAPLGLLVVGHVDPKSVAHRGRLPGALRRVARAVRHRARALRTRRRPLPGPRSRVRRLDLFAEPAVDLRRPPVDRRRRGAACARSFAQGARRTSASASVTSSLAQALGGRVERAGGRLGCRRAGVRRRRIAAVHGSAARSLRADREPPGSGGRRAPDAARVIATSDYCPVAGSRSANARGPSKPIPSSFRRSPIICSRAASS